MLMHTSFAEYEGTDGYSFGNNGEFSSVENVQSAQTVSQLPILHQWPQFVATVGRPQ